MDCHSNTNLILGLAGIAGTLLGSFIGAIFAYKSLNKQFSNSIKMMRVERTFVAYERLLELVINAQVTRFSMMEGRRINLSSALFDGANFKAWYPQYLSAWFTKQYLLDDPAATSCKAVGDWISNFLNMHQSYRVGQEEKPEFATLEALEDTHKQFFVLLENAHRDLKEFLRHRIEKV
jgi:hypothetical protein